VKNGKQKYYAQIRKKLNDSNQLAVIQFINISIVYTVGLKQQFEGKSHPFV